VNFDLNDEQRLLQDSLAGFLGRHYRFEDRAMGLQQSGWRPDIWHAYANNLGLFLALLPTTAGGLGGGGVEAMVIFEQFGVALVLEPYMEAIVLGLALLQASGPEHHDIVQRSIEGSNLVIPALYEADARFNLTPAQARTVPAGSGWTITADKVAVVGAAMATHFLVTARLGDNAVGTSLFLVDALSPQVKRRDYRLIDGRAASDLHFIGAEATLLGAAGEAMPNVEAALEAATAALCAEAVGVMRAMLRMTVDYARQRQQFGQPIARFQVLQHRMVDMHLLLEQSRSLAIMAALSLSERPAERRRAVSAAKSFISDAIGTLAKAAVQIHGGIGTADEYPISHYFKRATVISSQFGTASHHRRIMAETLEAAV
jgi:alkylation response protein AidB-like acyl-CoA dehydrogenase